MNANMPLNGQNFTWAVTLTPHLAFSFGNLFERSKFEPKTCYLHLTQGVMDVLEGDTQNDMPSKYREYQEIKQQMKNDNDKKERHAGVTLQCAIFDEKEKKRKKFLLGTFATNADTVIPFDIYFAKEQIENLTLELKGRTYFDKNDCRVTLHGNIFIETPTHASDINLFKREINNNFHAIIAADVIKRRKELHREKQIMEEEQSKQIDPSLIETHAGPKVFTKDDVLVREIFIGHGRKAQKGDKITIHFKGKLDPNKRKTFDRTKLRHPFTYVLGTKKIIKGINIGVEGMTLNGKRELIIPPSKGFGSKGFNDIVPPNATLYYDVELVELIPKEAYEKEKQKILKDKELKAQRRKQKAMSIVE